MFRGPHLWRGAWIAVLSIVLGAPGLAASEDEELKKLTVPNAYGFGAKARGGGGGRVLIVDRLDDRVSRPPRGTLRWALEQRGRRVVIFRTAGTIELVGKLYIRNPFVTVAGQTAPGGGITLKNYPLVIETRHVILQGLRLRPGAHLPNSDALNVLGKGARDVLIDHCSLSWANDEVLAVGGGARRVTIQNSIIAEGLDCSIHPDGCHSCGLLLRDGSRKVSVHHNLLAHNDYRNPKMFGDPSALRGKRAVFDFYNNVVYDWGVWAVAGAGVARLNVEANYFKLGPDTYGFPRTREVRSLEETAGYALFVRGNIGPSCPEGCADDWEMVAGTLPEFRASRRHRAGERFRQDALVARDRVVAEAGASYRLDELGRRVERRDEVDLRLERQFLEGSGGIIDDPAEVGGWPLLDPGQPVVDSDRDGMPDAWENRFGLDPFERGDGGEDLDGDRYSNLEEYLFERDPTVAD